MKHFWLALSVFQLLCALWFMPVATLIFVGAVLAFGIWIDYGQPCFEGWQWRRKRARWRRQEEEADRRELEERARQQETLEMEARAARAKRVVPAPGPCGSFEEGKAVVFEKYDNALRELADK